jgi:pilus assembly protein CpaE
MSDIKDRMRGQAAPGRPVELDMDAPLGASFAAALRDEGDRPDGGAEDLLRQLDAEGLSGEEDEFMSSIDGPDALDRESRGASPGSSDYLVVDLPKTKTFGASDFLSRLTDETDGEDVPPPRGRPEAAPVPAHQTGEHDVAFDDGLQADFEPPMPVDEDREDFSDGDPAEAKDPRSFEFGLAPHATGDRMVPRISIHAFCTKTPTLGLMRRIQTDRRLKNVAMEVLEGGIEGAIQHYGSETTPNLLILEASGDPHKLLTDLDTLAEFCDENIRVLILGETNDIRFYRELINRGVSEYLVKPIDPVNLIRSIANLFADPEAPFTGKTLAVTGVKGGVGSSCIAHNLAWALTERIKVNATLVDLDLNFGTTGLDFNQDTGATVADALLSPDRFDDAVMGRLITKATERLSLFTAPASLDRTYNLDPETYVQVLEQVRGSVPFIVLDLPHIWSDWFKSTVIGADEVIVVAAPELASLRNGKNLIDFLKAARPNDAPPRLVLNMVGVPKRPEIPPKDFGQAIGLDPTLVLPFEPQLFGTASNNGQMIFDVAPESKCSQAIDQLAAMLSGKTIQAEKPSLLKKILRR